MEYLKESRKRSDQLYTRIPELEVYIVNLHPLVPKDIPQDKDLIDDRESDILFHDRTTYDEQVAYAFTDFVNMARDLAELARSNSLSKEVEEILDKKAKTIGRVAEYKFTTYRDIMSAKPRISKVWRIDRLESDNATFGKITDFTPGTVRRLIRSGEIDARISIDRMEIIFAIEDLISDGIMSIVEGDEIMKEAREIITTEQLLYRKTKQEVIEAYDRYVRRVEEKNIPSERKEILISPGRDILSMISENSSMKLANQ